MKKIWNLPKIEFIPLPEVVDKRSILLVTSMPAWKAVRDQLHLTITRLTEATKASTEHWEALAAQADVSAAEVVYAVGGGLAVDAAKYLAARRQLPLVCIPTALSVDAFMTAASGIRRDGCVTYIDTKPPDMLLVDFDVIGAAPASLRAAGITDVLSIATGAWDWQFAHERGKNPPGMEFIPWVYANAQSILQGLLDCAEAAGRGDHAGLKTLLDCLCLEVQLCNQIGHARPEEGCEHYFAYAVENLVGHGLPHGDLVGPGILIAARLQGQDTAPLEKALRSGNIPLDRIPQETIDETLRFLPAYCRQHHLPYGIGHTLGDRT